MMKTRRKIILVAALGLLFSGAVFAHDGGSPVLNGGITVWGDSYGNVQYAGNLVVGAPLAYAAVPYNGYDHGRECRHRSHRTHYRDYHEHRHHGRGKGHKHRHKGRRGRHH